MDPLTEGLALMKSLADLANTIISKTPPEAVGAVIQKHEERLDRIEAFLAAKFGFGK